MIEEAKAVLRTWGAAEPNFLLTNSKLTFQMTMIPEKTQYLTQGPDGVRKLREGPNISSYRGLKIINSRAFSMEEGAPPRDVLRRRVRVAEYYRIPHEPGIENKSFAFYDESKDAWQKFTWHELFRMSQIGEIDGPDDENNNGADWDDEDSMHTKRMTKLPNYGLTDVSVDYNLSKELYEHMTVGEFEGGWQTGFMLAATGNLVLNPWYALCAVEIANGNGLEVPELIVQRPPQARAGGRPNRAYHPLRRRGQLELRRPHVAGPPEFPSWGQDWVDVTKRSEYMFHRFPDILKAFGYTGTMDFTQKADNVVEAIGRMVTGGGGTPADAERFKSYARGTVELPERDEAQYEIYLHDALCHGSLRGHPDYGHWSYQVARENFHRFLMLYLRGKADRLPPKAREFFDAFNWQGFDRADRVAVFLGLLSRIYEFGRDPVHPYPGGAGGGLQGIPATHIEAVPRERVELVIVRPNIEHNMLGIIMGRGGLDDLGATFWGQTELSCYDDSMHGELFIPFC